MRELLRANRSEPSSRLRAAVVAALAGTVIVKAASAEAQEADAASASRLEEVIVSATRTEIPISQTGTSVSVISSVDLQQQQAVRVFDVLSQVPGMSTGSSESVAPRVNIRGAPFEHTLVLIDGVRMTMPSFRRSESINTVTPDNIERIEVLKGPQSVLYGGDAAAGVINIITKRGEGAPAGSISAEYGSWNTSKINGTARGSVERFDYSVEGGLFDSDYFSVGDPNGQPDERRHKTVSTRLGYEAADSWRIEGTLRWVDTFREYDDFGVDADQYYEETDYVSRLQLINSPTDGRLENIISVARSGNLSQNFENGEPGGTQRDQHITQFDYQGNVDLRPDHVLTFGGEYNEQEVTGGIFAAVNPDAITNRAAFAQYQGARGGDLFYSVGARHDDNNNFGGFFTYKATAAYFLNDRTRLKGNLGTGFRTPSVAQLNGTSSCGAGNPDLEPEENLSTEIGIERRLRGGEQREARLEVNVFRNEITNVIVGSACDGRPPLRNKDRRMARGAEIVFGWNPTSALALNANFSYIDAEDIVDGIGARAEGIPTRMANISLNYDWRRVSLTSNVTYNADRLDPPATLDSFVVMNVAIESRVSDTFTVFGRMNNLLDEEYQTSSSEQTPDRNVHVGVRMHF